MSEIHYPERTMSLLPEKIITSGNHYGDKTQTDDMRRAYYIAKQATYGKGGSPVDPGVQRFDYAKFWVEENFKNGKIIDGICDAIQKHYNPGTKLEVDIYHAASMNNSSLNVIPLVTAEIVKNSLESEFGDDIDIDIKPVYKLSKVNRHQAFETLVSKPFYEILSNDSTSPSKERLAVVVEDDCLSGMAITEIGSAVARQGQQVIALAAGVCLCSGEKLHPATVTLEALRTALIDNSELPDPVGTFNSELKKYGFTEGVNSLTNIEALMIIAILYPPEKGKEILTSIWKDATDVTWDQAAENYYQGNRDFPISMLINQDQVSVEGAIAIIEDKHKKMCELSDVKEVGNER